MLILNYGLSKVRFLTLKVIQPDETSTAFWYYSNRKGRRYHAIKSPSATYEVFKDHSLYM